MKIVAFAGSLRADSLNKKLAMEAVAHAKDAGADASFVDIRTLNIPLYDGDLEASQGIPEGVTALGKQIAAADAMLIASPEYNGGISSILKNTIDWLSREKPVSLAGKHALLLTASPGALGGVRGLWHSRQPLEVIGVHVFPNMMGLSSAHQAFDEAGKLKDEKARTQLQTLLTQFIQHVKR